MPAAETRSTPHPGLQPARCTSQVARRCTILAVVVVAVFGSGAAAQLSLEGASHYSGSQPGARLGQAVAAADLDGNGLDELIAGRPLLGDDFEGSVLVTTTSNVLLNVAFAYDSCGGDDGLRLLGFSLVVGDFDGDGFEDVAIGAPSSIVDGHPGAGAVCVVYGDADLFTIDPDQGQVLSQANLVGAVEDGDLVGFALAAGDLDLDGYDDLVIGAAGEGVAIDGTTYQDAGAVHVVFGGPGGLQPGDDLLLTLDQYGFGYATHAGDGYGSAVAVGQGNGPLPTVFVGVPGHDLGGLEDTGLVALAGFDGREVAYDWAYRQGVGFPGTPGAYDAFGTSLVTADFNGDGRLDVAVGSPGESEDGVDGAGAVYVLVGAPIFLHDGTAQTITELGGIADDDDGFGFALGAGDFDGDGRSDLAIGSPRDDSLGVHDAGQVTVVYGAEGGLTGDGYQLFAMIQFGGYGTSDHFGLSLASGNFLDLGSADDLLVGVPGRENGSGIPAGRAQIIQTTVLFRDGFESGDLSRWSASTP
ncbi:MAG: hypothetical protein DWQ36_09355 [Acidobacteria bacterium]|nr:MAG: hypothetical protein DWQ30_22600 [Acidobacteriota bacterium]REK08563.1 MAG: hypothetical protein DWQ36_09355 [Acidobacteriota bacterium]